MPGLPPDLTFDRGGRPLSSWLVDLVSEDRATRHAAGEALQAMFFAVPSVHTEEELDWTGLDLSAHGDRLAEAIREAVDAPGFPKAEFVRALCFLRIALNEDWLDRAARMTHHGERSDRILERVIRQMLTSEAEDDRAHAARRFARHFCAAMARDERIGADAEAMAPSGFMAALVFDRLDLALLADRPGLRALLAHEQLRDDALRGLARIGPPAVEFAPELLEALDRTTQLHRFDEAEALGSIARDDPAVVGALLDRLRSAPLPVRVGAAGALAWAGPDPGGRKDEAIDLLLALADPSPDAGHDPELTFAAIAPLASIGRDRGDALGRLLELVEPRPPRWKVEISPGYEHRFDLVAIRRGEAINALGRFPRVADLVVPALVDALDTFEEFDPDWGYYGEHGRVCDALARFGPDAAAAVPRLVAFLEEWLDRPEEDRDLPGDVLRVLASIGPGASEALPVLGRMRLAVGEGDPAEEPDPDDPIASTCRAIRGG